MLKNITIGQHYPLESVIHNLDPRIKIVLTFIYMISLFIVKDFFGYIFVLLFLGTTIKLSKIPIKYILKGLKPIMVIVIITLFINIFMTPGDDLIRVWRFSITREGLYQGVFMSIRLSLLVMGTSILTLSTSPIVLTDGIEYLLKPFKKIGLPAHELAMMMTISLRFIPTLLEETDKIMKAQMARGADFETGNIVSRAKSLVPILVPLFMSSFRRADDLAMAMEARCYRGGENRTRLKVLKLNHKDLVAFFVGVLLIVSLIIYRINF